MRVTHQRLMRLLTGNRCTHKIPQSHTCPYLVAVLKSRTHCRCCDECRQKCVDEI
jgi:hypothetical protein